MSNRACFEVLLSFLVFQLALPIFPSSLKVLTYFLLLFISIPLSKINTYSKNTCYILVLAFVYPLLLSLILDINGMPESLGGYSLYLQGICMFYFTLNVKSPLSFVNIVMKVLLLASLIVLAINALFILQIVDLSFLNAISELTNSITVDQFSETHRPDYQPVLSRFYIRSALLFCIPASFYFFSKKYIIASLAFASLVALASRSALISLLFILLLLLLKNAILFFSLPSVKTFHPPFKRLFLASAILVILPILFPRLPDLFTTAYASISNTEHPYFIYIKDYSNVLEPVHQILGTGINRDIFNSYRNDYSNIEISQLRTLYYYGLPIGVLLNMLVLYFCIHTSKVNRSPSVVNAKLSLLTFYFASLANPVLLHPIWFLLNALLLSIPDPYHNTTNALRSPAR